MPGARGDEIALLLLVVVVVLCRVVTGRETGIYGGRP